MAGVPGMLFGQRPATVGGGSRFTTSQLHNRDPSQNRAPSKPPPPPDEAAALRTLKDEIDAMERRLLEREEAEDGGSPMDLLPEPWRPPRGPGSAPPAKARPAPDDPDGAPGRASRAGLGSAPGAVAGGRRAVGGAAVLEEVLQARRSGLQFLSSRKGAPGSPGADPEPPPPPALGASASSPALPAYSGGHSSTLDEFTRLRGEVRRAQRRARTLEAEAREARAQAAALRRENDELKARLAESGSSASSTPRRLQEAPSRLTRTTSSSSAPALQLKLGRTATLGPPGQATRRKGSAQQGGPSHAGLIRSSSFAPVKTAVQGDSATAEQMMAAARRGDADRLHALVQKGASVDIGDRNLQTPLHAAAAEGQMDTVLALLEWGASVNVLDKWKGTALSEALRARHTEVARLLKSRGAMTYAELKRRATAAPGDGAGLPPPTARGPAGGTSTPSKGQGHRAAQTPQVRRAVAAAHAAAGADAEIAMGDLSRVEEIGAAEDLTRAAAAGDVLRIQEYVTSLGYSPDATDYDKRTALHAAAAAGRVETVVALLELGAHTNPRDRWGSTPLEDAVRHKHEVVATILRQHGGRSAAEAAKEERARASSRGRHSQLGHSGSGRGMKAQAASFRSVRGGAADRTRSVGSNRRLSLESGPDENRSEGEEPEEEVELSEAFFEALSTSDLTRLEEALKGASVKPEALAALVERMQRLMANCDALATEQEVEALTRELQRCACDLTRAERALLYFVMPHADNALCAKHAADLGESTLFIPMGRGFVGACALAGAPFRTVNPEEEPTFVRELDDRLHARPRAVMCVPLLDSETLRPTAVMKLSSRRVGHQIVPAPQASARPDDPPPVPQRQPIGFSRVDELAVSFLLRHAAPLLANAHRGRQTRVLLEGMQAVAGLCGHAMLQAKTQRNPVMALQQLLGDVAGDLLKCEALYLFLADKPGRACEEIVDAVNRTTSGAPRQVSAREGVVARVLLTSQETHIRDAASDRRVANAKRVAAGAGAAPAISAPLEDGPSEDPTGGDVAMRNAVLAPVNVKHATVGVICAVNRTPEGQDFAEEDAELLMALGTFAVSYLLNRAVTLSDGTLNALGIHSTLSRVLVNLARVLKGE